MLNNNIKYHLNNRYITYSNAFITYMKTSRINYKFITFNDLYRRKLSDTIFILGSGPSFGNLSTNEIELIKKNDSFGINYSFLEKRIIPTFHKFGWHAGRYNRWLKVFKPYRKKYTKVVTFLSYKAMYLKMIHPRLTPNLFPENPIIYLYEIPDNIVVDKKRKIHDYEFDKSLSYRGGLSLILHFSVKLKYKNIVLVGVDLDTNKHFWDNIPIMKTDVNLRLKNISKTHNVHNFESQYIKKGKMITFENYLYQVSNYLKTKKNINLFIASKENMLTKNLPIYFL